jgi:hypothetical protein
MEIKIENYLSESEYRKYLQFTDDIELLKNTDNIKNNQGIAANPNTPADVLLKLLYNKEAGAYSFDNLGNRDLITVKILKELYSKGKLKKNVLSHKLCPDELLKKHLISGTYRQYIYRNPKNLCDMILELKIMSPINTEYLMNNGSKEMQKIGLSYATKSDYKVREMIRDGDKEFLEIYDLLEGEESIERKIHKKDPLSYAMSVRDFKLVARHVKLNEEEIWEITKLNNGAGYILYLILNKHISKEVISILLEKAKKINHISGYLSLGEVQPFLNRSDISRETKKEFLEIYKDTLDSEKELLDSYSIDSSHCYSYIESGKIGKVLNLKYPNIWGARDYPYLIDHALKHGTLEECIKFFTLSDSVKNYLIDKYKCEKLLLKYNKATYELLLKNINKDNNLVKIRKYLQRKGKDGLIFEIYNECNEEKKKEFFNWIIESKFKKYAVLL